MQGTKTNRKTISGECDILTATDRLVGMAVNVGQPPSAGQSSAVVFSTSEEEKVHD